MDRGRYERGPSFVSYLPLCISPCLRFAPAKQLSIDQFRGIKIQPKTINLSARLWEINPSNSVLIFQSLAQRSINCFRLSFNISKLVYLSIFQIIGVYEARFNVNLILDRNCSVIFLLSCFEILVLTSV